jgi:hypothetical protein
LASQKHSFAGENTVPTTPEAVKFTPDLGQSLEYSPLFHGIHDFPISRIALASVLLFYRYTVSSSLDVRDEQAAQALSSLCMVRPRVSEGTTLCRSFASYGVATLRCALSHIQLEAQLFGSSTVHPLSTTFIDFSHLYSLD